MEKLGRVLFAEHGGKIELGSMLAGYKIPEIGWGIENLAAAALHCGRKLD